VGRADKTKSSEKGDDESRAAETLQSRTRSKGERTSDIKKNFLSLLELRKERKRDARLSITGFPREHAGGQRKREKS